MKKWIVLLVLLLPALLLSGCSSSSPPQSSSEDTASSSPTNEDLQMQIDILKSKNEQLTAASEIPAAISDAENFLRMYFTYDTTATGHYNTIEFFSRYQDCLTERAKTLMKPQEDVVRDVSMSSAVKRLKTFGETPYANTVKTLSLVQVDTNISGIQSSATHLIQLTLEKTNDKWLVDSIDYDQQLNDLDNNNIF